MKIGIYTPYLDTAGGGEKYILTIAETLSQENDVDVLLDTHLATLNINEIKEKVEKFHQLDLLRVRFKNAPLGRGSSPLKRLFFLKQYDFLFALTDGSIFFSTAKNNILHFQVPFQKSPSRGLIEVLKLSSWNKAIYNSNFTKEIIEKNWKIKGSVVYPPVSVDLFNAKPKKDQILSVGRFSPFKKQDILIKAFKILNEKIKGWSLHLAGGVEGDGRFLEELKEKAKGLRVSFYPNISLKELVELYAQSSIYWHAAGFGESDPKCQEHFGITTVEAMSAGCVPIVINLGGQKEIVKEDEDGFLWKNLDELVNKTVDVIKDDNLRNKLSDQSVIKAQSFSKLRFVKKVKELVYGV